jgi:hypothetical protein
MVVKAQPVRAVILRSAIGALGEDDELHTSLEMQGLTAAWVPGDQGLSLIVGGGVVNGEQIEPAVTVILHPTGAWTLARTIAQPQLKRHEGLASGISVHGAAIGIGSPAIKKGMSGGSAGQASWTQAYRAEVLPEAFPGRPYVVEIHVHPYRFRVYLTKDEADDLKVGAEVQAILVGGLADHFLPSIRLLGSVVGRTC